MTLRRLLLPAVVLLGLLVLGLNVAGGGEERHRLHVVTGDATNVVKGQWIRASGDVVGRVAGVTPFDGGRKARIELQFDDEVWPLRQGARLEQRFGGTIAYANRDFQLHPGRPGGEAFAEGSVLPAAALQFPVEYDTLLKTFTPQLRADTKAFLDNTGAAVRQARSPLRRSLAPNRAPAAVEELSAVLADLDDTEVALNSLIRHGDRVVGAVHDANPTVGDLISGAATTFNAIAAEARGVQASIERAPRTLSTTRATLTQAGRTLTDVETLSKHLSPGVRQLRLISKPLASALTTVADVGPDAEATVRSLRKAAPDLERLLGATTKAAPKIGSVGTQGEEAVRCIRPFAPEIAGFFSSWASFMSWDDSRNRYVRLQAQVSPYPNTTPLTAEQFQKVLPDLKYSFPRPPGLNGGQPWLQPQCGIGPGALDPSMNPMDDFAEGGR